MQDVISLLNSIFASIQSKGASLETLFVSEGYELLMVLGLIVATWNVIVWLLDGDMPGMYVSQFQNLIKCGVIVFMLTGWTSSVHDYFVGNMQAMADRITGGTANITSIVNLGIQTISAIVEGPRRQATSNCEDVMNVDENGQPLPGTHKECGGVAVPAGEGALDKLVGFAYGLKNLPLILITILLKGLAIILTILMIVTYVVIANFGSILLNAAFCFGPALIPWFVLQQTSFLFDSWLRFTISAGLYKVVAAFMMAITAQLVPGIQEFRNQLLTTAQSGGDEYYATNYFAAIAVAIICGIGAWFMWQVPEIAGRLVSGSTGASARGFGNAASRFIPRG
ncbi:type IV secretion system protein [Burkholderia cenocepacia]|uniref:type IV secretion system protein n=1 Tax=Burkholderia cenocepacia TaxID=95486 RepID=UPI0022325957|nr:type IV secretion system protein [Burkholderia cenocepacia]MCW3677841.1 type IV secretion system protein [Burkholderia cenocepacia]